MSQIEVTSGNLPIVLGLPHTGTHIPEHIAKKLNATGLEMADTDWNIHQLYDGLMEEVSSVRTLVHRYVIDVNRDPSGQSLYPGQNTTGLCPTTDFEGQPIYLDGQEPDANEIKNRCEIFHSPYHAALQTELGRVKKIHGFAILYDCHSIRSQINFLFDGLLPDFNIGTNNGTTCAPKIETETLEICANAAGYTHVLNGRFKGGWTTRHYGKPQQGQHAIQMELAQKNYMHESAPWTYDETKAALLRDHLRKILTTLSQWKP
jgi:formiminoglutamase